ncbi:DEAD/DEAH box helicase [Candidatus Woesearchaeota archaeon]|nr:DEAD/DEAH box helicase [Candidatus Woesearchaeota archaeon]
MKFKGLELDRFQEESIEAIHKNHSVVVSAPTGSGKTLIADFIIERDIKEGINVVYTAPIKALSNQKFKEFSLAYGKDKVGLLTGDVVKNPDAPLLIMTTEIYRNLVIQNDPRMANVSYVILDEIHFINDIERGYVWEESIIFSPQHIRFLCLSATIPNAAEFAEWICRIKGHKVEVVSHPTRPVPLHKLFYDEELGITTLAKIREIAGIPHYRHGRRQNAHRPNHVHLIEGISDKLPCIFFCFSRAVCERHASELAKRKLFSHDAEIAGFIREKLRGVSGDVGMLQSTRTLRETLPWGIGYHHAGLLPLLKEIVEELFAMGKIRVLYTTETFAVGINMPAKTVCFDSLRKFDGASFRNLSSKEYFQIAGRAGRRGIDKEGYAIAMVDRRDFDYGKISHFTLRDIEPIRSQFRLSVNTVLNLIKKHDEETIREIIAKSFHAFQHHGRDDGYRSFQNLRNTLARMGYIEGSNLTEKGEFASGIYAEEILITEIFATDFYRELNEYQMLMMVAAVCYEGSERVEFRKTFPNKFLHDLRKLVRRQGYLQKEKRFESLENITSLVHPCYHGATIFGILNNTSLLEGDIIRLFRQIIDRMGQVRNATADERLKGMMKSCQDIILASIQNIDAPEWEPDELSA